MGALTVPPGGSVCVDSVVLIYTVEQYPKYGSVLRPLWLASQTGNLHVVSNELALLETLIGPLKNADVALQRDYEQILLESDMRLLPITQPILKEAARLRAAVPAFRTPDALHVATALSAKCVLFVTNDKGFRQVPGLPLTILDDVLTS